MMCIMIIIINFRMQLVVMRVMMNVKYDGDCP